MADDNTRDDAPLDGSTLSALGSAPQASALEPERRERLRARIFGPTGTTTAPVTIRADDGDWSELLPGIRKKTLFGDPARGTETYLLRAQPGASLPPHEHPRDEHCLVLEGEVCYGDSIRLYPGDYHLAPRGSEHEVAHTTTGALVYIQTA